MRHQDPSLFSDGETLAGTLEEAAVEAGRHVGKAWALTGVLRAMPHFLRQGRVMLPKDLIEAHDIERRGMLDMKPSDALAAAASDRRSGALVRAQGRRKLQSSIPKAARPALLLGVLVESYVGRIRRAEFNVFDPEYWNVGWFGNGTTCLSGINWAVLRKSISRRLP